VSAPACPGNCGLLHFTLFERVGLPGTAVVAGAISESCVAAGTGKSGDPPGKLSDR
jgi:hypothetical protein